MRMNESPRLCQTVVADTQINAHFGSCNGLMLEPNQYGIKPICGFSSVKKITAATATEVATVDEKIVR